MHPNSDFVLNHYINHHFGYPSMYQKNMQFADFGWEGLPALLNRRLIYGKYGRAWNKSWDLCRKKSGKLAVTGRFSNITHGSHEKLPSPRNIVSHSEWIRFERLRLHNHLTRNFASVSISFSPRKMVWKVNLEKIFIGPCWNVSSQVNRILKGGWWFPPIFPNLPQSSLEILKGFPVTPLPLNTRP